MENKGAAPAAAAQENNKEATPAPSPAPAASCFKWTTVAEDATFVEAAKQQYRQFKEASMEEHWSCIKNMVCSVLGETSIFGGCGSNDSKTTPSVKSQ